MTHKIKLRAESSPQTHFAVQPVPVAPFRAPLECDFERLKSRLLAETLHEAGQPGLNAPLRRAANEAAALAWVTFHPLLVFPELFQEKARAAVRQTARQERIYAHSREILAA